MDSLRNIGYDFPGAIADLVDNSIDARRIGVTFCFKGEASFIRISNDGCGMSERTVGEAMRYGTDRGCDAHDLGRFGHGLKTASLRQCLRLTLAMRTTRRDGSRSGAGILIVWLFALVNARPPATAETAAGT